MDPSNNTQNTTAEEQPQIAANPSGASNPLIPSVPVISGLTQTGQPPSATEPSMEAMARLGQFLLQFYTAQGGDLNALPIPVPTTLATANTGTTSVMGAPPLQRTLLPQFNAEATPILPFLTPVSIATPTVDASTIIPPAPIYSHAVPTNITHMYSAPQPIPSQLPPSPAEAQAASMLQQMKSLLASQSFDPSSQLFSEEYRPPYPEHINAVAYPEGYVTPKFRMFNGVDGNPREHVIRFLDTLGAFARNHDLRLREFSKTLVDKAYSWYSNLVPGSINSWEEMQGQFCRKFFMAEDKITVADLMFVTQNSDEDIIDFIKRFRNRCLEVKEDVNEQKLIEICCKAMNHDYRPHLINLHHESFVRLTERARNIVPSVKYRIENRPTIKFVPSGRREGKQTSVQYADSKGDSGKGKGKRPYSKSEERSEPPALPCAENEAMDLYEQMIRDGVFKQRYPDKNPTEQEKADPKYCRIHKAVGHPTTDCYTLRRFIFSQLQKGEIEIEGVNCDVNRQPFPKHAKKKHVSVISAVTEDVLVAEVVPVEEDTHFPDCAIEKLANGAKFRSFFDQLDFTPQARLEATEAIMKIGHKHNELHQHWEQPLRKIVRNIASSITFSDGDRFVRQFHNRPLYVTSTIREHELPRTLLDGGSSINVMPVKVFKQLGLSEKALCRDPVDIYGFDNEKKSSVGSIRLGITMGKLESPITFHVIDFDTSYQLLIGRAWMHSHQMVPSTYHQCAKAIHKGKEITIPATAKPFTIEEAHLADAILFEEFAPQLPSRPSITGVPMQSPRIVRTGHRHRSNSSDQPRKWKKVQLENGKIVYRL